MDSIFYRVTTSKQSAAVQRLIPLWLYLFYGATFMLGKQLIAGFLFFYLGIIAYESILWLAKPFFER